MNMVASETKAVFYWKNEFDSKFFGKDIYSFSLIPGKEGAIRGSFAKSAKGLVLGRLSINDTVGLSNALEAGFRILCLMVDFSFNIQSGICTKKDNGIRMADLKDIGALEEIAGRIFSNSRFHKEKTMSPLANEYHRVWIRNCLAGGLADVVLVAGSNNIDGFNAISYNKTTKSARIVLIGVAKDKQGLGIGKRLLDAGIDWANRMDASKVDVRTEAENISAVNLYLRNGFNITGLSVYLQKYNDI